MIRPTACLTLLAGLCACTASPPKVATPAESPRPLALSADAAGKPPYLISVGCVDVAGLSSKNMPTQILLGSRECVDKKDFDRGVRLFGVAGAYARFDSERVPDVSAQALIPAFQSELFGSLDPNTAAELQAAQKKIANSHELVQMCEQIRKLGPPTYYPTYMIKQGAKRNFDSAAAWESALVSYLHCPRVR